MVYTLRFFSSKCSLFHNSNVSGSFIIHILYTGCAKIKKNNSCAKRLPGYPYGLLILNNVYDFDVLLTVHLSIFIVLLTVHLSIFISLTKLMHKNLFHNKFYFMPLHVSSPCAHHQEVKIALHSLWYHHTETNA